MRKQHYRPALELLEHRSLLAVTLVSATPAGLAGSGTCYEAVISGNGRFVAFESSADDLTGNQSFSSDQIFVRDLITNKTELVSRPTAGAGGANANCYTPLISANGRFVVWVTAATNLVPGIADTNGKDDIFVHDRQTGQTRLVSINAAGNAAGAGRSVATGISDDGQRIVFISDAENLVGGTVTDANGDWDTFVRDLTTNETFLVSIDSTNTTSGDWDSGFMNTPRISANGQYVAFESGAHDLMSDPAQAGIQDGFASNDVFLRDLLLNITTLVSINAGGTAGASGHSYNPVMTPDARFIAFEATATDLDGGDTNGIWRDVFVRDMQTGVTKLASRNMGGGSGNNGSGGFAGAVGGVSISNDGRFVAFESTSTDLVANDSNGDIRDLFVRDLQANTTELVTVNGTGNGTGDDESYEPIISPSGRFVVFRSWASNLSPTIPDTGFMTDDDLFIRDLLTNTTRLISVNMSGTNAGNSPSRNAVISADGEFMVFTSTATDLVAADDNFNSDVYVAPVRDRLTSGTYKDVDGDTFSFKLTGGGRADIVLDDLDGDHRGAIDQIFLLGTNPLKSKLSISVKKAGGGDGIVQINSITGGGVKGISAKACDLVNNGIDLTDGLGGLTLRDILADVHALGGTNQKTKLTARIIGDGTTIDLDTSVTSFIAAWVGAANIDVPSIASLQVKGNAAAGIVGDFLADVHLSGAGLAPGKPALNSAKIAGAVNGAAITIDQGSVNSFQAGSFIDSCLCVGFEPTAANDLMQGGTFIAGLKLNSFKISATTNGFANSTIAAANVGVVALASATTANGGTSFGILVDETITAVTITTPGFQLDAAQPTPQGLDDFQVVVC